MDSMHGGVLHRTRKCVKVQRNKTTFLWQTVVVTMWLVGHVC